MKALEISPGTKFGRWLVVKEALTSKGRRSFICECSCKAKTRKEIVLFSLRNGDSTNCGCRRDATMKKKSDHSWYDHPLKPTYNKMLERCLKVKSKAYKNYGGRGIKVCKKWLLPDYEGFKNFAKWADRWAKDNNLSYENLELDREDNDGDYSPSNCRFITHKENNRNKRDNVIIEYKGVKATAIEILEKFGVKGLKHNTFLLRVERGWTVKEALTTPARSYK